MIRLVWLNRFLALLVFLLFFFVMTVGSVIVNETSRSSQQSFVKSDAPQMIEVPHKTKTSSQYIPAPASASLAVKKVYNHIDNRNKQEVYVQPNSNQANTFNEGYDWAMSHTVKQLSQCEHLSDASFEGCRSFVEVNHYVRQTQSNLNL